MSDRCTGPLRCGRCRAAGWSDARAAAIRAAVDAGDVDGGGGAGRGGTARAARAGRPHCCAPPAWRSLPRRDGAAAAAAFRARAGARADRRRHALQPRRRAADAARRAEAARAYQRALTFKPDLVAADFNLGVLFQQQGATDAAIAALPHGARRRPARTSPRTRTWAKCCSPPAGSTPGSPTSAASRRHCPKALPLAVQALEALPAPGRFREARALPRRPARRRSSRRATRTSSSIASRSCSTCCCSSTSSRMLSAASRDATTRPRSACYGTPLPRPAARRPGPLRIGYLSADLRNHVMGKMMWQAIAHHDRARFELYFYAISDERDEWTRAVRGVADALRRDRPTLDERAAAQRIAADDLDILVDLSTHTRGARPGILARKPARVQITHVASAGTVGLVRDRLQAHRPLCRRARRTRSSRSRRCCRWTAACIRSGTSRRRRSIRSIGDALRHRRRCGRHRRVRARRSSCRGAASRCGATCWTRIPRAKLAFSPANPALRELLPAARRTRPGIARSACCSCRRAATMPRTRRATGSSISCSTRCRSAASTARSRRSTWACRWSRSSASAMASARRTASCQSWRHRHDRGNRPRLRRDLAARLADDPAFVADVQRGDTRGARAVAAGRHGRGTRAIWRRRTRGARASARPTRGSAPDRHGRRRALRPCKRALPRGDADGARALADAMLADSGLAMPRPLRRRCVPAYRAAEALDDAAQCESISTCGVPWRCDAGFAPVERSSGSCCADAGNARPRRGGVSSVRSSSIPAMRAHGTISAMRCVPPAAAPRPSARSGARSPPNPDYALARVATSAHEARSRATTTRPKDAAPRAGPEPNKPFAPHWSRSPDSLRRARRPRRQPRHAYASRTRARARATASGALLLAGVLAERDDLDRRGPPMRRPCAGARGCCVRRSAVHLTLPMVHRDAADCAPRGRATRKD